MELSVSFGNVSSGAFFSDDISNNDESIVDNVIFGFSAQEIGSELVCLKKIYPEMQSGRRVDLSSAILKHGYELVISQCLDKLDILRLMTRETVDDRWYDDIRYRPPHKRFHDDAQQLDEEDYNLNKYTNIRKLTKDICRIYSILMKSLVEFQTTCTANELQKAVKILEQEQRDLNNFRYEFEANRYLLWNEIQDVNDSESLNIDKYNSKASELYKIQQQYEDVILFSKIKMTYLNRWEDHRHHLNLLSNEEKEKEISNLINKYKQKIDFDQRVNLEISNYMKYSMIDMQQQIEHWMEQYDEALEKMEGDIYAMNVTRERCASDLVAMKNEYDTRSKEILLWLEFKEELRKKMELEELMRIAATKIQAWWRGTMVRRKLGPYRRKKKGKKGKGKKTPKKLKKKS